MKPGTQIEMADGRVGTVVYNGLDGVGIKWGLHDPTEADFEGTHGGVVPCHPDSPAQADDWPWKPDAMLRSDYPGSDVPCVGSEYHVTRYV